MAADPLPESSAAPPPNTMAAIELALAHEDLLAFARIPGLVRLGPSRPANMVWHDNADGTLEADGLALVRDGKLWRLERLRPEGGAEWPAACPAPVLDENASPGGLRPTPPFDCGPVAALAGRSRAYALDGTELHLLCGRLRSVVGDRQACRLTLTGPSDGLTSLGASLAGRLRLSVPRSTLALEAMAVAKGNPLPARHLGAPALPGGLPVSDGLAYVVSHLLDVLLHRADQCRVAAEPEAVHQARVATRRLRSALSIYKRAAPCPELEALKTGLRECASRLGAARDWDVFLEGTGTRLAGAPNPQVTRLLRTAQRRRNEAYAELRLYLASPELRALEIGLACAAVLRPWERSADPTTLQRDTADFAADVLRRRLKRVRKAGRDVAELPIAELHELRKDCKRLRYAAEFFGPAFPKVSRKRFGKRLADLQEELGALNDTAAAAGLMQRLGRAGRGYAGGIVEGWASASGPRARERIGKAWKRFRAASPFWDG